MVRWQRSGKVFVLIETYWNVNVNAYEPAGDGWSVLIETYWNVNLFYLSNCFYERFGINRNILECKCSIPVPLPAFPYGINRNILECKFACVLILKIFVNGINRNILECKLP